MHFAFNISTILSSNFFYGICPLMLDGSEIDLISSFSEDEQNEEEELPQQQQQQQVHPLHPEPAKTRQGTAPGPESLKKMPDLSSILLQNLLLDGAHKTYDIGGPPDSKRAWIRFMKVQFNIDGAANGPAALDAYELWSKDPHLKLKKNVLDIAKYFDTQYQAKMGEGGTDKSNISRVEELGHQVMVERDEAFAQERAAKKRADLAKNEDIRKKIQAEAAMNLVPNGFGVQSPGGVALSTNDHNALALLGRQTGKHRYCDLIQPSCSHLQLFP